MGTVLSLLPSTVEGSPLLHDNFSQEVASSELSHQEGGKRKRKEGEKGGMKGEGERRMCVFMCVEGGGGG